MNLLIATPTHSSWTPEFGHSLSWTMATLAGMHNSPVARQTHGWMDGTIIADLRNDLVRLALKLDASHILWTDCDMEFTPDNAIALMKHDKAIVGTNYMRRLPPHKPTAIGLDGEYVHPGEGLEQVLYTGMGLMLTKTSVFKDLPEPWFFQPWNEETRNVIGEDLWFCRIAKDNGIAVWVDHDASVGVGHVGKQVLTLPDVSRETTLKVVS